MKITDFVNQTNIATFQYYRAGYLYYSVPKVGTDEFYQFSVEAADLQQASVNRTERAVTLMRYIRKALNGAS